MYVINNTVLSILQFVHLEICKLVLKRSQIFRPWLVYSLKAGRAWYNYYCSYLWVTLTRSPNLKNIFDILGNFWGHIIPLKSQNPQFCSFHGSYGHVRNVQIGCLSNTKIDEQNQKIFQMKKYEKYSIKQQVLVIKTELPCINEFCIFSPKTGLTKDICYTFVAFLQIEEIGCFF